MASRGDPIGSACIGISTRTTSLRGGDAVLTEFTVSTDLTEEAGELLLLCVPVELSEGSGDIGWCCSRARCVRTGAGREWSESLLPCPSVGMWCGSLPSPIISSLCLPGCLPLGSLGLVVLGAYLVAPVLTRSAVACSPLSRCLTLRPQGL